MIPTEQIDGRLNLMADFYFLPGSSGAEVKLPVFRIQMDGRPASVSCWRLTWKERLQALLFGRVWLIVLGKGHPAVSLRTESPLEVDKNGTTE